MENSSSVPTGASKPVEFTSAIRDFASRYSLRRARIAHLDITDQFSNVLPKPVTSILFGLVCAIASVIARFLIDEWVPGAGPFAVMMPFVLVATLFGRWSAGLVCLTAASLYAWYYVLPFRGSFLFTDPADGPRVAVNIAAGAFVVLWAEIFRFAIRQALSEREALLLELEHRVKNNFASVASMLRLQMRAETDEATKLALQSAIGRIESFARANSSLYRGVHYTGSIQLNHYLVGLCGMIQGSLGADSNISIKCQAAPIAIPRDRAILLGLLLNEVATNSVKYAFCDQKSGEISVIVEDTGEHYRMIVRDNGRGMSGSGREGSLGMKLIESITRQARGSYEVHSDTTGVSTEFLFEY